MRRGFLLAVVALLTAGAMTRAVCQEALGFVRSDTSGSPVKLEGFVFHQVKGGYLIISVPPKDVLRVIEFAKMIEPHMAILDALLKLDEASKHVEPATFPAVPLGACFLATNELFLGRHKILDREVRSVGTFTYNDRQGRARTMIVYVGGPTPHRQISL